MAGAVPGVKQKRSGARMRHNMKGKTMIVKKKNDVIEVKKLAESAMSVKIIGKTPYLYHSISDKSAYQLLMPTVASRKAIDRKATIKHLVPEEYLNSTYRDTRMEETYLHLPSCQPKAAMRGAAMDSVGTASKAGIGRLLRVTPEHVPMYGVPQIHMATVRMSGPSRTPDIRTRAVLPEWCAELVISYFKPHLTPKVVMTLLSNAGLVMGLGDWRPEKGGAYGQFGIVSTDKEQDAWDRIRSTGGREAQYAAMHPDFKTTFPDTYDDFTERMLAYFVSHCDGDDGVSFVPDPIMNDFKESAIAG